MHLVPRYWQKNPHFRPPLSFFLLVRLLILLLNGALSFPFLLSAFLLSFFPSLGAAVDPLNGASLFFFPTSNDRRKNLSITSLISLLWCNSQPPQWCVIPLSGWVLSHLLHVLKIFSKVWLYFFQNQVRLHLLLNPKYQTFP